MADHESVPLAGRVVVGDEDHLGDAGALHLIGVLVAPLIGTARCRRRAQAEGHEAVGVLLAFDVDHALGFSELVQAVVHAPDTRNAPRPAAAAVRAPEAKVLRIEPHGLIEQLASLVAVGV